jgi:hypothetical protein
VSLDFPCTGHAFFSQSLSNHWKGAITLFLKFCTKFDAVSLLRNCLKPDAWLQIEGHKKSAHPPSCAKLVHWLHLPLQHTTVTVVQMIAPVLEIMGIPLYGETHGQGEVWEQWIWTVIWEMEVM